MEQTSKKSSLIITLVIYTILFYAVWSVKEIVLKPILDNIITNDVLGAIVNDGIIKNLVWILPAALLVRHFEPEMHIGLKEMFTTKVNWLHYLPVFILLAVWALGSVWQSKGALVIQESFGWGSIIELLFVGITEEMVFRGWLLNATTGKNGNQWFAVALNAVMFVLIHFPCWIAGGEFISIMSSFSFLSIAVLGVIFSVSFLKSKNILVPVALHMFWDLLGFMYF